MAYESWKRGPKNQWRRTLWNEARKRVIAAGVKPKDAVCLYLPGADNLDASVATAKGFRQQNMIGVERDASVRESLRKSGVVTVKGSIEDIVCNWPESLPLNVVNADLCCGLTATAAKLVGGFVANRSLKTGCVLVINMLRGRDSFSSDMRQEWYDRCKQNGILDADAKHRGFQLYGSILRICFGGEATAQQVHFANSIFQPLAFTYRSRAQWFDSLVLTKPNLPDGDYTRDPAVLKFIYPAIAIRTARLRQRQGVA